MNALLKSFDTKFDTVPFSKIKDLDFKEAFDLLLDSAQKSVSEIKKFSETPTFDNTIDALERALRDLGRVYMIFSNLWTCDTNDLRNEISLEYDVKITSFFSELYMDEELFKRVDIILTSLEEDSYTDEQRTIIKKIHRQFVNNGVSLSSTDKEKVTQIDKELAAISVKFSENVRNFTNEYVLNLKNREDLEGLPEWYCESAKKVAEEKGIEGYAITLDIPSFLPFMQYCGSRYFREKLYKEYSSRAYGDKHDNSENIRKIVNLRLKRANILGFETHADYVLTERMALSKERVKGFLDELLGSVQDRAKEELCKLTSFARDLGGPRVLERWDFSFYMEKYKEKILGISDEILRPYLKLDSVLNAIFDISSKLYGISFKKESDIDLYHEETSAYQVLDNDGSVLGLIYFDFFPRKSKKGGAWMTLYKEQYIDGGVDHRPHVSLVCNFTPKSSDRPSLLTFNEVTTLFHEFGHGLHGLLTKCNYQSCSGPNVLWDFVELPSQIMENWAYESEVLNMFAKHFETGAPIPSEYVEKIREERCFFAAYSFLRQLEFATLDMSWHSITKPLEDDIVSFEKQILGKLDLFPSVDSTFSSAAFLHIFSGGYSAGYYSYKWAELLEADAYAEFERKGIFNQEVANSFRENILEKGGSEHPSTLFKRFKGRDPEVKPLLKKFGLD